MAAATAIEQVVATRVVTNTSEKSVLDSEASEKSDVKHCELRDCQLGSGGNQPPPENIWAITPGPGLRLSLIPPDQCIVGSRVQAWVCLTKT